jgi:chemotaxis protein CheX
MSNQFIPFKEPEIEAMVSEAVEKFFSVMLDWPVECVGSREGQTADFDDLDAPPPPVLESDETIVVGMVGFIGALSGVLNIHLKESLALDVTSNFLGMTLEEIREEGVEVVNDALGEMGNMVGGTFKNSLCDSGYDCRMTLPSILRGRNFTIETPSGVFRRIYDFKTLDRVFSADLTIKPGE